MAACGLDFGTSNTTLGSWRDQSPQLAKLEGEDVTIPSAIFFDWSGNPTIGRAAMDAYVEGVPGRLMRSLKSVLGTALIEEITQVGRKRLRFREVIALYLKHVKARAEASAGQEFHQVVHGRPVHFVDGNPEADRKAEEMLRAIAHSIGFRDVSFQFEPIAAALDYERTISHEEIALIADIGGGTSDFSIVRISPDRHGHADRVSDILANDGVRIGGVDFDRLLSLGSLMPLLGMNSPMKRPGLDVPSGYFHDLATWSNINRVYTDRTRREIREVRREARRPDLLDRLLHVLDREQGHALAMGIETVKINLSETDITQMDLAEIEPDLGMTIARGDFAGHTERLGARIGERIENCLHSAGLRADRIDALFLTGGSTRIPHVRDAIRSKTPNAKVVEGDTFGAVGTGLVIESVRRYA
jgi:hypothetical chaperone protein